MSVGNYVFKWAFVLNNECQGISIIRTVFNFVLEDLCKNFAPYNSLISHGFLSVLSFCRMSWLKMLYYSTIFMDKWMFVGKSRVILKLNNRHLNVLIAKIIFCVLIPQRIKIMTSK